MQLAVWNQKDCGESKRQDERVPREPARPPYFANPGVRSNGKQRGRTRRNRAREAGHSVCIDERAGNHHSPRTGREPHSTSLRQRRCRRLSVRWGPLADALRVPPAAGLSVSRTMVQRTPTGSDEGARINGDVIAEGKADRDGSGRSDSSRRVVGPRRSARSLGRQRARRARRSQDDESTRGARASPSGRGFHLA
jgi:hypothetical protein